ncbi:uncharacterized membrane protein (DUF485 family) [Pseudosporangium ferrugineum]|uniref:Uncharacterized membrane protein (DUF485 family) n=1 Tax=Pseudosporangium ferrugineum TaxID=439699 RepID=A0A2T0S1K3_9ACTN|nr:uncharacterized membrane protein (DUF485 family) [Pseudosporangium ferrugineum]
MTTDATPTDKYLEVQQSAEFAGLRRKLRNFVFPMTIAFFLWYSLYVLLSAYARGFMSVKLVGNINVALLFGLLQFVSTFLIAWYYSRYAAKELDPIADKIGDELAGTTVAATPEPVETDTTAGTTAGTTTTTATTDPEGAK